MPRQLSLFDALPVPPEPGPAVVAARGPRAAEAIVLAGIEAQLAAAAGDLALLARPIRVVVPSRSLRQHVAAALVARRGRAAAGVVVQTLHGLACEVLANAGEAAPAGAAAFDLLAERFASGEPALARPLGGLAQGYGAVAGAVRDLLDAGFTPAHADAAEEALAEKGSWAAALRARALVHVAAQVERAAERLGIGRASHLLRRAVELLAADPDAVLPSRALWLHGFAAATGVATDLLARLLKLPDARLVLDLPPDPAHPDALEASFTERLSQALAPGARFLQALAPGARLEAEAGAIVCAEPLRFAAPGVEAEVREAAMRALARLAAGVAPERIGIVARDLAPYRRALRRHLGRLGVPFSGVGERGGTTSAGRRAAALLDLLESGETCPCDRWLEAAVSLPRSAQGPGASGGMRRAVAPPPPCHPERSEGSGRGEDSAYADSPSQILHFVQDDNTSPGAEILESEVAGSPSPLRRLRLTASRRVDLRLATRALGAGRLSDLAAIDRGDVDRLLRDGRFALPIRQGLRTGAAESGGDAEGAEPGEDSSPEDEAPRASRAAARSVPGEEIHAAREAAAALAARFAAWPTEAPLAAQRELLAAFLEDALGWSPRRAELGPLYAALAELDLPAALPITRAELARLLRRQMAEAASEPLGGAGGGVQVLSVAEARGRTWESLFVLGMNRDLFPRAVREDPLLPDDLRAILRGPGGDGVLPDVPIKRSGFDEERYLFAQLLAAAPEVTLSWQAADDDGRPLAASPLLARAFPEAKAPPLAPPLYALDAAPTRPALPAIEEAVRAGIHGGRDRLRPILAAAIAEARADLPASPLAPEALAAARLAVLDEIDPDRTTAAGRAARLLAGPYMGFLGRPAARDPRHRDLHVTDLEAFAACPWQTFLERLLAVGPTPDPLEALPGLEPLTVGNVVHAVLERIVARARRSTVDPPATHGWDGRAPVAVPWPAERELDRFLAEAAERVAAEEGIPLRGLARALAERARPFLEEARKAEWGDTGSPPLALGAELRGELALDGGRRLLFRVDRVDAAAGGGLLLTDYKTGRPFATAKKADARRRAFLRRVYEGRNLQTVAYALAAAGDGKAVIGRYLFLRPDAEERAVEVRPDDRESVEGFRRAAAAVLEAWDAGALFPRLVDVAGRQEPSRCKLCRVAEACLRGDSGARSRLLAYAERTATEAAGPEATAFAGVWLLADGRDGANVTEAANAESPEGA